MLKIEDLRVSIDGREILKVDDSGRGEDKPATFQVGLDLGSLADQVAATDALAADGGKAVPYNPKTASVLSCLPGDNFYCGGQACRIISD